MSRLTQLEKEMLHRAAHFVLAGEWPWELYKGTKREDRREEREQAALKTAAAKLEN